MLQRANDIKNYSVHAVDGDVGGVEGFYFDDERLRLTARGAPLHRDGHHFQYSCPSCGLAGPCAETAEEAKQGWRAAAYQRNIAEQASAVKQHGLTISEPLDKRDMRIIRILYGGKWCAACAWLSRGPMP